MCVLAYFLATEFIALMMGAYLISETFVFNETITRQVGHDFGVITGC